MRLTLLLLVLIFLSSSRAQAQLPPPHQVDRAATSSQGIRELRGKYLRLFTDLPSSESIDELPAAFDAAVPLWCEYFGVPKEKIATWRVQGFLISDREKFAELGLLPTDNRKFLNGFAHDRELWLVEQPSDYYRRHLLLHEGTHTFMLAHLGGAGPGWHMEGLAELLGTHRWQPENEEDSLKLAVMPDARKNFPMWGRIKLIKDAVRSGKPYSLNDVLQIDNRRPLNTNHYAWSWALCWLLENDSRFTKQFHALRRGLDFAPDGGRRFNHRFYQELGERKRRSLEIQWLATVATLDFGYDHQRMRIEEKEATPLGSDRATTKIAADRGWQSTGWQLEKGKRYQLEASGRYRIALDRSTDPPTPWPCEPGGITLQYHKGQPLGKLQASLVPVEGHILGGVAGGKSGEQQATFTRPLPIGLGGVLEPQSDSVIYLRVNDHASRLVDNEGEATVIIQSKK